MLTKGPSSMKWCSNFMIILWRQSWRKTPTHNYLLLLNKIVTFILMKRLWGDRELIQGMGISIEKGLSRNSRYSVMKYLHRKPLKLKISSPGIRSITFSYQCCPALSPSFFNTYLSSLKPEGLLPCKDLWLWLSGKAVSIHDFIPFIYQQEFQGHLTRKMYSSLQWINISYTK